MLQNLSIEGGKNACSETQVKQIHAARACLCYSIKRSHARPQTAGLPVNVFRLPVRCAEDSKPISSADDELEVIMLAAGRRVIVIGVLQICP